MGKCTLNISVCVRVHTRLQLGRGATTSSRTKIEKKVTERHAAFSRPIGDCWSQQSQSEIALAKVNAAFPQWKPRRGFRYRWKLIASDFQFQRQSSLIPKWIFIQEQSHVCSHYFQPSTFLDLLPSMLGWVEGFKKKLWVWSSSTANQCGTGTTHLHQPKTVRTCLMLCLLRNTYFMKYLHFNKPSRNFI